MSQHAVHFAGNMDSVKPPAQFRVLLQAGSISIPGWATTDTLIPDWGAEHQQLMTQGLGSAQCRPCFFPLCITCVMPFPCRVPLPSQKGLNTHTHSQTRGQTMILRHVFMCLPIQMLPNLSNASKKVLIKRSCSYNLHNKKLSVFIPVTLTAPPLPVLNGCTSAHPPARGVQPKQPGLVMI